MQTPILINKISRKIKQLLLSLTKPSKIKLRKLHNSGALVVIPIGFRCYTKSKIKKYLGVELKKSYPFDSGFFPPLSVARVLKHKRINLNCSQSNPNHTVCIKQEEYNDSNFGYGIKFNKSTYEEINSAVVSRDMDDINKYLDSTFGYYTLDMENQFILAHYNWHVFANENETDRVYNPVANINNINVMLNRRLDRMFEKCNTAKYILFIFGETQGYRYMMIDDCLIDLHDLSPVDKVVKKLFPNSIVFVKKIDDVNSPKKVLSLLNKTRI